MATALPIALQLYTIRDVLKEDVEKALEQVARIGYGHVELAGLYDRSADDFKRLLDQHGLKPVCTHEGLDQVQNHTQAVIDRAKTLGYRFVAAPWIGEEWRSVEGYQKLAGVLNEAAAKLDEAGLTLLYHNHDFEFKALPNGSNGWEILFGGDQTPAYQAEMDTCWVYAAGSDPIDWLKRLSGRVPLLHMKDWADGKLTEIGRGKVPLQPLAHAAPDHGVQYLVVEQDNNWTVSPMDSARVGFENLKKLLA